MMLSPRFATIDYALLAVLATVTLAVFSLVCEMHVLCPLSFHAADWPAPLCIGHR